MMEYTTLDKISENLDSMRKPITSSDRLEGEIPYYGASGVVDSVKDYIFDEPLLLVSEDGANLLARSTPIAFSIDGRTWVNNHAHVLRFQDRNLQKYVEMYLNHINLESYITGSAQPKLNQKKLNEIPIPVADQNTIVQVVSTIEKVNSVIKRRKQELQKLDELIKARFVEMFGNPITNDRGWEVAELNTVCDGIGDGLHGTPEYDEDGEYPFINGNNLMDGVIKDTPATKMVNEDTYKKHFIELTDNAILLSINGTLGKLAFYNGEEVMLGKSACYCNLKPEINREFVYGVMKTDAFAGFLESNATASTIKNVGLKAIRGFKLILPPEELQFQFIEFAEQVDKSKVAVQAALDKAQLLFDSLMQEYFG